MSEPLIFTSETPLRKFVAYIDPENIFATEDKLSQINTLQQMSNIASYEFLRLDSNRMTFIFMHIGSIFTPVGDRKGL